VPPAQPAPPVQPAAGTYGAPAPVYAPPSSYAPSNYGAYRPAGAGLVKPIGIIVLVIVESGIAAVGIWVALGLFFGTLSDFAYGDYWYSFLDVVDGTAFLAASGAGIALAVGVWKMRPIAWVAAHLLNAFLIGLIVANVVVWGLNLLDVIGVAANLSVLASLNANPMRRHFGRRVLF
jgi:hypothetical protein